MLSPISSHCQFSSRNSQSAKIQNKNTISTKHVRFERRILPRVALYRHSPLTSHQALLLNMYLAAFGQKCHENCCNQSTFCTHATKNALPTIMIQNHIVVEIKKSAAYQYRNSMLAIQEAQLSQTSCTMLRVCLQSASTYLQRSFFYYQLLRLQIYQCIKFYYGLATRWRKIFEDIFIHFDATHKRGRHTDRRMDEQTPHDSKGRAYASHRAAKTSIASHVNFDSFMVFVSISI